MRARHGLETKSRVTGELCLGGIERGHSTHKRGWLVLTSPLSILPNPPGRLSLKLWALQHFGHTLAPDRNKEMNTNFG